MIRSGSTILKPPEVLRKERWVGYPYRCKEDLRLVTGRGAFIDNIRMPGMLYAAILRSPYPHARIRSIDTSRALAHPAVRTVLVGEELTRMIKPFRHLITVPDYYPMAIDRVRFVGEPVAAVAAEDMFSAEDAVELIDVKYEPLPPAVDLEEAMKAGAPLLHEKFPYNVAWHRTFSYGDPDTALSGGDLLVEEKFYFHRYASTPLEPTGCIASFDQAAGELAVWDHNHQVGLYRVRLADALNMKEHKLRHMTPRDMGGTFGNKIVAYPYTVLISLLSMKTGSPVKWIAKRREDLAGLMHSADRTCHVQAAIRRDGVVLGLSVKTIDNFGAYLRHPEPQNITRPFMTYLGCYGIRNVKIDAYGVFTNKCPTGPNRGYGCQHTMFMIERTMDLVARRIEMDPAEIRLRNMIGPGSMPYRTPFGCVYDGGDYPAAMRKVLEAIDYERARAMQRASGSDPSGRLIGIGVAAIVEPGPTNASVAALWGSPIKERYASTCEAATVRVHPAGNITVLMGTAPSGQNHETVAAQIVADQLGVSPEDIEVLGGFDSHTHPFGGDSGTYASRFAVVGAGALLGAASKVREKAMRIAAVRLGVDVDRLEFRDATFRVKGSGDKSVSLREIARIAYNQLAMLPKEIEPGLEGTYVYRYENTAAADDALTSNYSASYAYAAGGAIVEVDRETGAIQTKRLVIVHDAGVVINPLIMDGQIEGAIAHGFGGALFEEFAYNREGQLLTSTFSDYLVPGAEDMPKLEIHHMVTPSEFTPLGSKGSGEGTSILIPSLMANAVDDALSNIGCKITSLPLTPEKIWRLMRDSDGKRLS